MKLFLKSQTKNKLMQFVPNLLTSQEIIATISIQKAYSFISNMENLNDLHAPFVSARNQRHISFNAVTLNKERWFQKS